MAKNSRKKNKNLIMHKKGGTYNLQCDERMRAEHGRKRGTYLHVNGTSINFQRRKISILKIKLFQRKSFYFYFLESLGNSSE